MKPEWEERVQALQRLREEGGSSAEFKRQVSALEKDMFSSLCPKKHYKESCEPAYCTFSYTESCGFLEAWKEVGQRLGL